MQEMFQPIFCPNHFYNQTQLQNSRREISRNCFKIIPGKNEYVMKHTRFLHHRHPLTHPQLFQTIVKMSSSLPTFKALIPTLNQQQMCFLKLSSSVIRQLSQTHSLTSTQLCRPYIRCLWIDLDVFFYCFVTQNLIRKLFLVFAGVKMLGGF